MGPFLAQIDPAFGRDQYGQSRTAFEARVLGVLPIVREYPRGVAGSGDVDSGPVVLGASAPASVVGIGAALAAGDSERAEGLRATVELLGLPWAWGGERAYAGGRLPVGDAFLAWASSVPGRAPAGPDRQRLARTVGRRQSRPAGGGRRSIGLGSSRAGSSRARASISGHRSR